MTSEPSPKVQMNKNKEGPKGREEPSESNMEKNKNKKNDEVSEEKSKGFLGETWKSGNGMWGNSRQKKIKQTQNKMHKINDEDKKVKLGLRIMYTNIDELISMKFIETGRLYQKTYIHPQMKL